MTTSAPTRRRRTSSASTPSNGVSSSILEQPRPGRYALKLYVTGMTPRSIEAVAAVKDVCEGLLDGNYDLEVVDLYVAPARASEEQVIAAPTLVRQSPQPVRRLIGNLSDPELIRKGLQLGPRRA